nr:MAG TPA: hypothetical protein [Caudoviricetes sp.]
MEQPQRAAAPAAAGNARPDAGGDLRADRRAGAHFPALVHARPAHQAGNQRRRRGSAGQRGERPVQESPEWRPGRNVLLFEKP